MAIAIASLLLPMKITSLVLIFVILCIKATQGNPVTDSGDSAKQYLQQFGYLDEPTDGSASIVTPDTVKEAVTEFQKFAGLTATGVLDSKTVEMMNKPRCGCKDIVKHSSRRKKRYSHQGSKWSGRLITYRISKYPSAIRSRRSVNVAIEKAFKYWGDSTNLTFFRIDDGRNDIDIRFERRRHGDKGAFDGPGYTLAHAFYPEFGGAVHFDDEEDWTIEGESGTNLLQVAVHEFGHVLGLQHSRQEDAIMTPFFKYRSSFRLQRDDIAAIKLLYGGHQDNLDDPLVDHNDAPNLCQDPSFDTITQVANGNIYIFKGDYYWRVLLDGLAYGYPRKISDDWTWNDGIGNSGTLPSNLDTCVTWASDKTYFFKGTDFWSFQNFQAETSTDPRYPTPRPFADAFPKIPKNDLQAAFMWIQNKTIHFFKGGDYWLYEPYVQGFVRDFNPLRIEDEWPGVPNDIDAAFQPFGNKIYFFKGDKYWRFDVIDDKTKVKSPGYPRSTTENWFGCSSSRSISDRVEAIRNIDP